MLPPIEPTPQAQARWQMLDRWSRKDQRLAFRGWTYAYLKSYRRTLQAIRDLPTHDPKKRTNR